MGKLLVNIKELYGINVTPKVKSGEDLKNINSIKNAWLLTEKTEIVDWGLMSDLKSLGKNDVVDCRNKYVFPTFCDSHTHLVFAAPRDQEFVDRINGLTYEEIAKRGGGILNSVKKLKEMSEDQLFEVSKNRLKKAIGTGTGAIEIKSGYGLDIDSEIKMLRVIKRLKELNWIPVKATFLGAHAIPQEYQGRRADYLKLIGEKMLPRVAEEKLADYIDIFCESGYFDVKDTDYMLSEGKKYGLKGKIHVNQFNVLGGVTCAVKNKALSVDHLEYVEEDDVMSLKKSETIATSLPSCSFFLRIPYTPMRKLLNADIKVALASDYNPGSTPSANMSFVWSLACIKLKMTPIEALNALTINGAAAMELENKVGSISKGLLANLIVSEEIPSLAYIPYAFGESQIEKVMINGEWF